MNKTYEGALFLQKLFNTNGYKTLAAGGFVRDYLLGREPNDIDLATQATPDEMESLLFNNDILSVPLGIKHGTLCVRLGKEYDYEEYEITTLRKDVDCDGRHATVEFCTSFEEDSKRRDFTMNALYMDLETKEIFDYVGGIEDIKNKVIRFVGDPEQRILEDRLRVLRLFRFYAQIENSSLDRNSFEWAQHYLPQIHLCSVERIQIELFKMLTGIGVIDLCTFYESVIFEIIPLLKLTYNCDQDCQYHFTNVFYHSIEGLEYLKQFKDPVLSFAHLLHDIGKPFCKTSDENGDHFYNHEEVGAAIANRKICYELKLSTKDTDRITFIIQNHMRLHQDMGNKAIRRFVNDCNTFSPLMLQDMLRILIADYKGMIDSNCQPLIDRVLTMTNFTSKPIKSPLNGHEIMDILNISEGPMIGKIMNKLKEMVIDGELDENDKEKARLIINNMLEYN